MPLFCLHLRLRLRNASALQVLPGARLPTDGTVVAGSSFVDESMLTGESGASGCPLLAAWI